MELGLAGEFIGCLMLDAMNFFCKENKVQNLGRIFVATKSTFAS
jgi:hypothetical protein